MEKENKNIFDDDNALDFIMLNENETKDTGTKSGKGGCLGIFVLLLLPFVALSQFIH